MTYQCAALQVKRDLQAGRLPPVQPFHAMAYPFSAELALAISAKCAPVLQNCMRGRLLSHRRGPARALQNRGCAEGLSMAVFIGRAGRQICATRAPHALRSPTVAGTAPAGRAASAAH